MLSSGAARPKSRVSSGADAPGNTYNNPVILHNRKFEKTKGYCTDVFFDEALKWIDARRRQPARRSITARSCVPIITTVSRHTTSTSKPSLRLLT